MEKLVVVIMGQNCEKFIGMALDSVSDADEIIYCDGGSTDDTLHIVGNNFDPDDKTISGEIIENKYDQEDKQMNGKQRNFYLDHLKKKYPGWWCLAIDADEVVEDLTKIKEFIQKADPERLYNPKMRHFIGDLGHEDATVPEHFVYGRLFKIKSELEYPLREHSIIVMGKRSVDYVNVRPTTIWHMAYCSACWDYKKRYKNHLAKSKMHSPEFLDHWYKDHLFGQYPKSPVNPLDIPETILKEFEIDKDEFYFQNRGLELRHFLMFKNWFDKFNPKRVLEFGCGFGPYGVAATYLGCKYSGVEISKYATLKNPFSLDLIRGDITNDLTLPESDLVLVIDVLEHLEEEELNKTLGNIAKHGKNYVFSIPYFGDPNLEADPTHKIKQKKEWWVKKLEKHFKIKEVPSNWLFKEQMLIGEKK